MDIERSQFAEGIMLAECCLCSDSADVAPIILAVGPSLPRAFAVLARAKNLMGGRSEVVRVENAALSAFEQSAILCDYSDRKVIDFLISTPTLTVEMLKSYRQDYWILVSEFDEENWGQSFGTLRAVFDFKDLNKQVEKLLVKVPACCRLWCEGNQNIFQVFYRSSSED